MLNAVFKKARAHRENQYRFQSCRNAIFQGYKRGPQKTGKSSYSRINGNYFVACDGGITIRDKPFVVVYLRWKLHETSGRRKRHGRNGKRQREKRNKGKRGVETSTRSLVKLLSPHFWLIISTRTF